MKVDIEQRLINRSIFIIFSARRLSVSTLCKMTVLIPQHRVRHTLLNDFSRVSAVRLALIIVQQGLDGDSDKEDGSVNKQITIWFSIFSKSPILSIIAKLKRYTVANTQY